MLEQVLIRWDFSDSIYRFADPTLIVLAALVLFKFHLSKLANAEKSNLFRLKCFEFFKIFIYEQ